jgi:hypothetical protein
VITILSAATVIVLFSTIATDRFAEAVSAFVFKRSGAENVTDAFYRTRGVGIESHWANFLAHPWTGTGFGVYADGHFPSGVVRFWGLPISASVEKGFLPSAVLEETGILGGLAFTLMILQLCRHAWRNNDLRPITVFVACLAVNVGESLLLAPGGVGVHIWCWIALSIAVSRLPGSRISAVAVIATDRVRERRFPNIVRE